MQTLVRRTPIWVLTFALTLAAGCDNQVTEPTSRLDPDDAVRSAKAAAFNRVTALEPLPGSSPSHSAANAINDLGQVVGESSSDNGFRAVIWDHSTVPQSLGALTGQLQSSAVAISSNGNIIAGSARDASANNVVRWLKSGAEWLIDPLPSGNGCDVGGMSTDGTAIVGTCGTLAVVWLNGARIVLGEGLALGVNSNRQAVGTNAAFNHALLWNFSTLPVTETDLGNLGGTFAVALNINDAGQVTGWSETAGGVSHAFLWSPKKRTMVDLAPGGITSGGYAINATGKVVGDMFPSTQHAGYYDGRKVVDLGTLPGYSSAIARGLNNNNQAVGFSSTFSSQTRATLWVLK